MKTRYFFISQIVILILFSHSAFPQGPANTFAYSGTLGVYVILGPELPSPSRPVHGAVGYLVERRLSGVQTWQQIATVAAPASLADFRSRLETSMREVTQPMPLNAIPVNALWQAIQQYGVGDSLKLWSEILPVRLAVGMMYFDSTAERGVHYQYRVSLIDPARKPILVYVSNVVSFPGVATLAKLHLSERISSEHVIDLKWIGEPANGFYTFIAYRQDGLHGAFIALNQPRQIFAHQDTIFCSIIDTSIAPYQIYRYYLLPTDAFGNPGIPSDTVLVGSYRFTETPLPDSMEVTSMDSTGGLRISWSLQNAKAVRSLTIYRSADYDKDYEKLAYVSPQAGIYVDQTAKPMTRYFYYITMTGLLGEISPPSAKVFGLYVNKLPPFPPMITAAVGTPSGVRLSIKATDNQDAYFHIYRNDGFHRSVYLVSGPIQRTDSLTIFDDTNSVLSGSLTYAYSVVAENTSHLFSKFSDTVYVRPLIPTHPPTPLDLKALHEGNFIQLYWSDMQPFDNLLRGYLVFRKNMSEEKTPQEFARLSSAPLPVNQNHYTDTTAEVGVVYRYAVCIVDLYGVQSALSAPAGASIPSVKPIPPAGLSATSAENGILLQWDRTQQPDLLEYRLYRYQRGTAPLKIATVAPSDSLEVIDSNTTISQLYFYYLTSVNTENVESGRSVEIGIRR